MNYPVNNDVDVAAEFASHESWENGGSWGGNGAGYVWFKGHSGTFVPGEDLLVGGLKRAVAGSLGALATPSVVAPLIDALADVDAGVREEANAVLERLVCRNFGVDQARWREWWAAQPPAFPLGRCR